ncbi:hypothetical protein [Halalkalibacter alkalisediminis]|uniref:Uncharacterized protein n=1 Tax=Halalkalibacter alkalisediminis TaxID=935616 RepID=A0ABV6NFR1_9BACI|nr:hypothetical protein [Halalkalibacter alkalisediminis]
MKKSVLGCLFLVVLLPACHDNKVNENEILSIYDDFLHHVTELFAYHTFEEDVYFNEKYHTEESIRTLLDPFMTDDGINQMLEDLYMEEDNRFVYREDFQSYLRNSQTRESSYYDITRQTVFNPGLRMLRNDLQVIEEAEHIELTAVAVPVQFYSEESTYGVSQFGQLGYPAVDHLSLTVTMVKEEDGYFIQHVEIQS